MKLDRGIIRDRHKTFVIIILIIFAWILTYYFHFVLKTGVIVTHFFYIPTIIAAVWWKRKGIVVPFFLIGMLFLFDVLNPLKDAFFEDVFRAMVLISVSLITVLLSERIEKSTMQLKNSEEQFRTVVESAFEGIVITDESNKIIFVNDSILSMFGYSKEELIGQQIRKFIPSHDLEKHGQTFARLQDTQKGPYEKTFEMMGIKKDGTEMPFEITLTNWEVNNQPFITSVLRDITIRKETEKTQAIFSAIVQHSEEGIIGKDLEGHIISWNPAAEKIYGYKTDEVMGKSVFTLFPDHIDELKQIIERVSRGEVIGHYETKRVTKQGNTIDVSLVISPLKDADGKIVGVSTISRNITHEKIAEKELEESDAKLRLVTSHMVDIVSQSNVEGDYIYASPSVESVLGFKPTELIGKSVFDYIHPDDIEHTKSALHEVSTTHVPGSAQFRYRKKDGSYIWVETRGSPLFRENGETYGYVFNSRDITEQKEIGDALRESEEKYRSVIESADDIILIVDYNGRVLLVNEVGAKFVNMERHEILGGNVEDFLPESYEVAFELLRKVYDTGEGLKTELPIVFRGDQLWFSASVQPLFGSKHEVQSVQVIARDITEIKEIQIQLEQTLKEKEMLMKEIYHRVKNNLMVISSLLNLQSGYIEDEKAKSIFKESQNRANSMAIIHQRLYQSSDLKNIDFGDYIHTLANDLYDSYVPDPERVGLNINADEVKIDINTSIPLGLIINELLSNSMKHGFPDDKKGEITIDFHKVDGDFILEVKDTGVGIPEDIDIFNTGSLGMQLITSLTQQISGELEFARTPNTCFRVTFPETEYGEDE